MRFGPIDNYMLFGGGEVLFLFAQELVRQQVAILIITSARHAAEIVAEGKTLSKLLAEQDIPCRVVQHVESDEVISTISSSTMGLSFGAAWIFREDFIARFNGRLLNMHCTRLPQNRGGGGYSWLIMKGELIGMRLLHLIDCGIDTGAIVASEEYLFPTGCRKPIDFHEHEKRNQVRFLLDFVEEVKNGKEFVPVVQQETFCSYFPRLNTDIHGFINWEWNVSDIERFVCAFDDPYKGASTFVDDRRLRLKDCYSITSDGLFHPFQYGLIYRKSGKAIFVAAKGGSLAVQDLRDDAGNDQMGIISVGDRLYTPAEHLEKAMRFKAVYLPDGMKP